MCSTATAKASSPRLIRDLGAIHHPDLGDLGGFAPDMVMECTGAISVVKDVLGLTAPGGIVCLLSVTANRLMELDIGWFNRKTVLDNDALFGAVNANLDHYRMARGRAGEGRPDLARTADHAARAARALERGAGAPQGRHQVGHRFHHVMP